MPRQNILDLMGGLNQVKVTKGHQVQIFKLHFQVLMHRQCILYNMAGQDHQVQIFKKCIFDGDGGSHLLS